MCPNLDNFYLFFTARKKLKVSCDGGCMPPARLSCHDLCMMEIVVIEVMESHNVLST